ncbi:hypothetical protein AX14_005045 [Amanita brunnescens Koide BX004]|nr:hypothetical protein AX14_005045 [Amanita brunnescens Koide BX004]
MLQVQKENVLVDAGPFDREELVTAREPLVDVNRYGRVGEGEASVNTDPSFVDDWSDQVVAFQVSRTGDLTDEVNGGFLNEQDVYCVSARVEEIMDCLSRFVGILE